MSTPFSPDARYWADPSSRPAVLALLIVLMALTIALLSATGRDVTADATPACPGPAMHTTATAPPTGTTPC
jgi:hypothetical protein